MNGDITTPMLLDTTLHCYKKNVLPFFLLLSQTNKQTKNIVPFVHGRRASTYSTVQYPVPVPSPTYTTVSVLSTVQYIQYCIPGYSTEYSIYIQYYTVQYKVSIIKYTVSIKCTIYIIYSAGGTQGELFVEQFSLGSTYIL